MNDEPTPVPTRDELTDARMDAIGLIGACIDHKQDPDVVSTLMRTSDHQPWQLAVVLAQLAAAMVEQFSPVYGITEPEYLNRLRGWVLDTPGGDRQ